MLTKQYPYWVTLTKIISISISTWILFPTLSHVICENIQLGTCILTFSMLNWPDFLMLVFQKAVMLFNRHILSLLHKKWMILLLGHCLWELNKVIRCSISLLPHIQNILKCHLGYSHFNKLDVWIQFFAFELDKDSQLLCVISTPFGCY